MASSGCGFSSSFTSPSPSRASACAEAEPASCSASRAPRLRNDAILSRAISPAPALLRVEEVGECGPDADEANRFRMAALAFSRELRSRGATPSLAAETLGQSPQSKSRERPQSAFARRLGARLVRTRDYSAGAPTGWPSSVSSTLACSSVLKSGWFWNGSSIL